MATGDGDEPSLDAVHVSSEDEDGDEEWRAAIDSVAGDFLTGGSNGFAAASLNSKPSYSCDFERPDSKALKHSQLKVRKALQDLLEKTIVIVKAPEATSGKENDRGSGFEDGIRLFKDSPVGILLDRPVEIQGPKKKPRILRGEEINEKSKQFKQQIQSIAVDGMDILALAKESRRKALARKEAREAAAKEAAKRAEEQVKELKRIRGEKWLPSIAREMKLVSRGN
ncbi:hypothetical protein Droror1_Dr00009222 [Drosera rotundifolia]